jgi:hypothetical protein
LSRGFDGKIKMPPLRQPVDETQAWSPESLPALQADSLGYESVGKTEMIFRTCKHCRWWQYQVHDVGFCRTDPTFAYMSSIEVCPLLPGVWAKHDEVRTRADFGCNRFERGNPKIVQRTDFEA